MRQVALIIAVLGFLAFGMCARAYGAERQKRPVVCMSYEITKSGAAVCYDSKRPFVMAFASEVVVKGPEGNVKALVGWR
jgi:hypothetical protein